MGISSIAQILLCKLPKAMAQEATAAKFLP